MAASKDNAYMRVGGIWRSTTPSVRVAGSWRTCKEVHVKVAGSWRKSFVNSDPITLSFYPVWTNSFGQDTVPAWDQPDYTLTSAAGNIDRGLHQGDWSGVGHASGGMGPTIGIMRFDHAAIAAAFGGRTVVSSAKLRLHVRNAYGPSAKFSIYSSTYGWTNTRANSFSGNFGLGNLLETAHIADGAVTTATLANTVGDQIISGTIKAMALWNSTTGESAKLAYRMAVGDQDSSSSLKPMLTLTADY